MSQKLNPVNWRPFYLYMWIILQPGKKPISTFGGIWNPDKLEEVRQKEIQRWRQWKKRDDIDVLVYRIREVELVLKCYKCGYQWEEVHDKVIREFHCPECLHFNTLKHDEKLYCKEAPSMERYRQFTLDQWEEYERYWGQREGSEPVQLIPAQTEKLKSAEPPKKKEQPKQVFEQLELFPEIA